MKIVVIHTSLVSVDTLKKLFAGIIPEAEVFNIIDESLLDEVKKAGKVTPCIQSRMNNYVLNAALLKPDLIFNQCSSVGEAFDCACRQTDIKTLKIDVPMAEKAVGLCPEGGRISVVATVASTLGPSLRVVEKAAADSGRRAEIFPVLIDGALTTLMNGGRAEHDALVKKAVQKAAEDSDVIVLAQGSMYGMPEVIGDVGRPVLTSPRLAVERARQMLTEFA